MDRVRRGIVLAVAPLLGAAPAMAVKGISNIGVRRPVKRTPAAARPMASGHREVSRT
jgi:hypothetical protein